MTDNKPVARYKLGSVELAVFKYEFNGNVVYKYKLTTSYKTKEGKVAYTDKLSASELPIAQSVIQYAIMSAIASKLRNSQQPVEQKTTSESAHVETESDIPF